jgi:hypothetical protein
LQAGIRSLERLILHQDRLHQSVSGVRSLSHSILDQAFGIRVTLGIFERGEAVEQLDDELAFLWCHGPLLAVWSQDDLSGAGGGRRTRPRKYLTHGPRGSPPSNRSYISANPRINAM